MGLAVRKRCRKRAGNFRFEMALLKSCSLAAKGRDSSTSGADPEIRKEEKIERRGHRHRGDAENTENRKGGFRVLYGDPAPRQGGISGRKEKWLESRSMIKDVNRAI
jgi:hypothetical protein